MKINDFDKQPIQENIFSNLAAGLAGTAGSVYSGIKGDRKPNFGSKADELAKKSFIEKFVSRGTDALKTAIAQGLVDVNAAATTGAAATTTTTPTSGTTGAQTGTGAAAKPQVDVDVDSAVKKMRSFQPTGTKPLPGKFADELNKDLQYVSKNKDYLLRAAGKIDKFNAAGYDMKPFYKNFMGQYAIGKKQQTIQEDRLQEIYHRLTTQQKFKDALRNKGYDPDLAAKRLETLLARHKKEREERKEEERKMGLDEGFKKFVQKVFKRPAATTPTPTPSAATPPTTGAGASMGEWLKDNFIDQFLQGVPWKKAEPQINKILDTLPQIYKDKKKLNQALTSIAEIGWALSPKLYDASKERRYY